MTKKNQEKLFTKFRRGEMSALSELLEAEKVELFDYLIRMTGSIAVASDTIEDVFLGLADGGQYDFRTYRAFRICLYETARKFNGDKWNAETSRLENPAYSNQGSSPDLSSSDLLQYRALDKSLRGLPGRQREVVVLKERCGFPEEDIASIMELSRADVESLYLKGMQQIDAECSGIVHEPEKKISQMPGHPVPEKTSAVTMDLSMVMAGIQQNPTGIHSPVRIAFALLILAAAICIFLYPELLEQIGFWDLVAWITEMTNG